MVKVLAKYCLKSQIRDWQKIAQIIDRQSMKAITKKDDIRRMIMKKVYNLPLIRVLG